MIDIFSPFTYARSMLDFHNFARFWRRKNFDSFQNSQKNYGFSNFYEKWAQNLPVAAVVAVSSKLLLLLEPEDDDLELSEFAHVHLRSWLGQESLASAAHQIHDHLFELVNFAA